MPDTCRVKISAEASSDIQRIYDYVSQDSPQNAANLIAKLIDAIDSLEFMPTRFRKAGRSRSQGTPVHSVVVESFILYYRVDRDVQLVTIMTFRHGHQRQPRRFP